MGRGRICSVAIVLVVFLLTSVIALAQAFRPASGTQIVFLSPEPDYWLTPGDIIIVTGRSVGLMNVGGTCGSAPVQVQSATVVDPGNTRATRITNEFLVTIIGGIDTSPDGSYPPIAAGTRFTNPEPQGDCTGSGGQRYLKYLA